ncbi:MAG: acylphosphatase [Candidatus Micrarchaeota archaeon]|nr:acylphosphatase [Candidatus Micrarchaeota archaeon]
MKASVNENESIVLFRVYGLVQGVFYRATCKSVAQKLGLKGYVKNLDDGSVEIGCYGPKQKVEELISWSKKGPRNARVDKIEFMELTPKMLSYIKSFGTFEITG